MALQEQVHVPRIAMVSVYTSISLNFTILELGHHPQILRSRITPVLLPLKDGHGTPALSFQGLGTLGMEPSHLTSFVLAMPLKSLLSVLGAARALAIH